MMNEHLPPIVRGVGIGFDLDMDMGKPQLRTDRDAPLERIQRITWIRLIMKIFETDPFL
jgi:hypothetical protein